MDWNPDRCGSVGRVTVGNGMMASAKMKLSVLKNRSPAAAAKTLTKEASPDSKCPICLDRFRNISYVDKCLHRFCFRCIHEWAKNKAECPLCKQPFSSIYHSIKAEDDFQQYHLRPTDTGSFGSLAGQRFRYRTTLTGDHRPERRTSPPPDHGVMFEGLSGSVSHGNDRGFRRMVARLAARQRAQSEGRALRTLHEQEMIQFRRTLYRRGLRVRDVRDGGRSRETSAEFFRGNPACLHRLVPWLKRELTVLYGTHGSLVNIVQHIVMSQITRYDMQDPAVLQELRPFLLSRTEHFLHEFQSFARSPFNMEAYDQNAVYDCPAPSAEDSGGSDSSIITVSEDEVNLLETRAPAMLSQTPWDDETPGPSYSIELPRVSTVSVASSDSDSEERAGPSAGPSAGPTVGLARVVTGEENHSGSEDCMIVGYVKPTSERTPELVQLSSDSEEEVIEEKETKNNSLVMKAQPQHIRFTSPPDSPSSSQSASPHRPTATDRNRPSLDPVHDRRSTSPRRSSANSQRKNDRHHSKSKRRDRSRNRDSSSHGHRRRSRSKDRKQSKETSSFYRYHTHPSHTRHSYESSRSHTRTQYINIRKSPEKWERSRALAQSQERARDWDYSQSQNQSRDRSLSREHSHARSRERSHTLLQDYSHTRSQEHSRVRSREHSHTHSQEHSRTRSRDRSHARSQDSHSRRSRSLDSRQTRHPSPSSTYRNSRHDKPGGKRKYKSLHLEPAGNEATEGPAEDRKKRSSGKHKRKHRSSRSPSVEIVCQGDSREELLKKHHRKKKKHKKKSKSKRKRSRERKSPTVITINSESDTDGNGGAASHPSANDDTVPSEGKAALGLLMDSNASKAANSANSSSITPEVPIHSVSQSDQNITALGLNSSPRSANANDPNGANDSNDANNANSTSIPSQILLNQNQHHRPVPLPSQCTQYSKTL